MPLLPGRRSYFRLMLTCLSGAMAVSGWVMFGLEYRGAATVEASLRSEIDQLKESRDSLVRAAEQNRMNLVEAAQLRAQISASRTEIERLTQSLAQAQAELASGRTLLSPVPDPWTAADRMSEPEAQTHATASGASIQVAQEALTRLGYGPLAADGILGPSTRGAIERFQLEQGLAASGDLDAATWQRLRTSGGVAAAE